MRVRTTGVLEGDAVKDGAVSHRALLSAFAELRAAVQRDERAAGASLVTEARLRFASFVQDSGYECVGSLRRELAR